MTPHQRKISAIVDNLLAWYPQNARDLPWRRTKDPYAIHVSEIMLQQTQVKTVIPFWERWLRELPTVAAAARASPDKLHKLWEGLGYYTRVRNLQKAAQVIVAKHGGRFPRQFDPILALPGIGPYTAGAICSIAFNQPTPILDGNVIRVLTRAFGIADHPKEKAANQRLWRLAEELVVRAAESGLSEVSPKNSRIAPLHRSSRPKQAQTAFLEFQMEPSEVGCYGVQGEESESKSMTRTRMFGQGCSHLNQSLMELGALVCTPRNAQCQICPVKGLCVACRENRVEALPNLGERPPATARNFAAFVIERDGKFLVRQRPAGVVNSHLWEFPNVEIHDGQTGAKAAFRSAFGFAARGLSPLISVRHSITRYRITLKAFRVDVGAAQVAGNGVVWKTPAQMQQLAFTSAHRKVLHAFGAQL